MAGANWASNPYLLVALGGALGSVARYAVGRCVTSQFPDAASLWGTAVVNWVGSFLLGAVVGVWSASDRTSPAVLFLGVGLCGGLTTFSTLSMELANLIRDRQWGWAMGYGGGSLVMGWSAFLAGIWVVQQWGAGPVGLGD